MFTTQEAIRAEVDYRREQAKGLYRASGRRKEHLGTAPKRHNPLRKLRRAWTV